MLRNTPFSIRDFLYRYLAGGIAIREGRIINRALFIQEKSCEIVKNPIADKVKKAVEKFSLVINKLTEEDLSFELLSNTNSLLLNVENTSSSSSKTNLRKTEINFNALNEDYNYACPHPDVAIEKTNLAIKNFNLSKKSIEDIIAFHAEIILSHPFSDGNGRTARAIIESMFLKYNINETSPYIYILAENKMDDYLDFLHYYKNRKDCQHHFIKEYLIWSKKFIKECHKILESTQNRISNKLTLINISSAERSIITELWKNPIISQRKIHNIISNTKGLSETINTLLKTNIVEIISDGKGISFIAKDIYEAHINIESLIFKTC